MTTSKRLLFWLWIKKYHIQKAEGFLGKQQTYKTIPADPSIRQKNRLINLLKNIKAEGGILEPTYRKMYSTWVGSSKYYGLPNIHKIPIL